MRHCPGLAGFHVLAGDQGQQGHRCGLLFAEVEVLGRPHQLIGVIDQFGDEPLHVGGVLPVTRRPSTLEVVLADPHRAQLGDEAAYPGDLGHEHGDGVLAGHRVIQHGGVQCPAGLARDHPGFGDDGPHRVEDPLGSIRGPQLVAPQDEHRRVERLVCQGQAGRCLPGDVGLQPSHGLADRETFKGLEDHDGGDDIGGNRGSAPGGGEQVLEQLVREHRCPVLGQEGVHRAGARTGRRSPTASGPGERNPCMPHWIAPTPKSRIDDGYPRLLSSLLVEASCELAAQ